MGCLVSLLFTRFQEKCSVLLIFYKEEGVGKVFLDLNGAQEVVLKKVIQEMGVGQNDSRIYSLLEEISRIAATSLLHLMASKISMEKYLL